MHMYTCLCACVHVCVCLHETNKKSKEIQFYKSVHVLLSSEFKFPEDVASFREFITLLGIDPGVYGGRESDREREKDPSSL